MLAARAAEALGLPGHPPEAVRAASSKLAARQRFAAAGLITPWFLVVPEGEAGETMAADARVRYPCVLKPTSLSGSRGVIRVDTPEEFAAAVSRIRALLNRREVRALRHPDARQIIVEGFLPGRDTRSRGCCRRAPAGTGGVRQAGSAGRPVLRGDDLRHAAAPRRRRSRARFWIPCSRRSSRSACATGRSTPSAASMAGAWSCSRWRRGRLAACARASCSSCRPPGDDQPISLEELLLRHAARRGCGRMAPRAGGRGGDDDPDPQARTPAAGRRGGRRPAGSRASWTCRSRPGVVSCWSRCRKQAVISGSFSRARGRQGRPTPRSGRPTGSCRSRSTRPSACRRPEATLWPVRERNRGGGRRLHRRRSPPCAWRPAAAPLSARA